MSLSLSFAKKTLVTLPILVLIVVLMGFIWSTPKPADSKDAVSDPLEVSSAAPYEPSDAKNAEEPPGPADSTVVVEDIDEYVTSFPSVYLDVPLLTQMPELPAGCEATSVAMMLNFAGANTSKFKIVNMMPRSDDDPSLGYVGNPFEGDGWTIYPAALVPIAKELIGSGVDLSGDPTRALQVLSQGHPVVCWVTLHGFYVHAIVLTGFDDENIYYNDPWTGEKDASLSVSDFDSVWGLQEYRALSY
jgi:uncharacterized protein YvpB